MKVSHVAIIGGGLAVTGVIIWLLLQEKKCAAYTTQSECVANGCYWYDGSCHSTPKSCSDYATESECTAGGCYWYGSACHSAPEPGKPTAEIMSISAT